MKYISCYLEDFVILMICFVWYEIVLKMWGVKGKLDFVDPFFSWGIFPTQLPHQPRLVKMFVLGRSRDTKCLTCLFAGCIRKCWLHRAAVMHKVVPVHLRLTKCGNDLQNKSLTLQDVVWMWSRSDPLQHWSHFLSSQTQPGKSSRSTTEP